MPELTINRYKSLRSQIADQMRDSILNGNIEAGSRLPSTTELSKKWGTQTANVHAALSILVKEGLLTRKNGVGTIVNKQKKAFKSVLIYHYNDDFNEKNLSFYRLMFSALKKNLAKRRLQCQIVNRSHYYNSFSEVEKLISDDVVQGVILVSCDQKLRKKFDRLPVPYSCITTASIKNRVSLSFDSLIEKAIEGLLIQKCRKVGLIMPIGMEKHNDSGSMERRNFFSNLCSGIRKAGLELRDEWTYTPKNINYKKLDDYDQFAYDGFNHIWNNEEKPDGLFVYTDELISGTLISILANHIKIPEDLKLVFHRNKGRNILCPMPCYFVENDVARMADGLVQLVIDQYKGKEINQINFDYDLIKNQ